MAMIPVTAWAMLGIEGLIAALDVQPQTYAWAGLDVRCSRDDNEELISFDMA